MAVPYVTDVTPPSTLELNEPFLFTLFDSVDITRAVITIFYPGLRFEEVVWAGTNVGGLAGSFTQPYSSLSSAILATDGGDYGALFTVLRSPVWPDAPTLRVYAVDVDGDEV